VYNGKVNDLSPVCIEPGSAMISLAILTRLIEPLGSGMGKEKI